MNIFIKAIKRKGRVFGAEMIARLFHVYSDPKRAKKRKFLARSNIFFRQVARPEAMSNEAKDDFDVETSEKKDKGAMMYADDLDKGHMGVRGFLYFNFVFKDADGDSVHIPGYALVREHGDTSRPLNPTRVFTWSKSLAKTMCQTCSDKKGFPVDLNVNDCTKKVCGPKRLEQQNAVADYAHPSLPLNRLPVVPRDSNPLSVSKPVVISSRKRKQQYGQSQAAVVANSEQSLPSSHKIDIVEEIHQVIVLFGKGKDDKGEVWFGFKTNTRKKDHFKIQFLDETVDPGYLTLTTTSGTYHNDLIEDTFEGVVFDRTTTKTAVRGKGKEKQKYNDKVVLRTKNKDPINQIRLKELRENAIK